MAARAALARILMVDDTPANLLALESILEPLGHTLVRASSGEEALRKLLQDDYALVLMDVRMPGLDGLQAAALMKQRSRSRRTPIILISGISGDREDILRGYQQGAVDYLVKPIQADILSTKVSVFVDLYLKAHDIERQSAALLEHERAADALRARMHADQLAAREQQLSHFALRADVSAALSKNDELRAMLQGACESLVRHLHVSFVRVWTMDPTGSLLILRASAGKYTHLDGPHAQVPVGALKIGLIAEERQPHLTNDVLTDPRVGDHAWARREGMVAFAGYPLLVGDRVVGVVAMFAEHALDAGTLNAVETVADLLAQGIVRKRAEEALDLRAEELARSNAELERFAYVASHDLQEPLRMVASYTQLIGRRYKGKLDSDADEFIAFAVDGANRMQTLINDLLAFSRVGTKAGALVSTSAEHALDLALANLRLAIEESGAVVTRDALPTVVADERQLIQIFQNLIGNALKFRGEQAPRIHVGAERVGGEVRMLVKDNGIGIDPRFFDRLFVLFQRLHTRSEYEGNGIGLAICKKIVERCGGRIWVEASPGHGSTFIFTLRGPST